MNAVKVGDTIRFLVDRPQCAPISKGDIGTIISVNNDLTDQFTYRVSNGDSWAANARNEGKTFELVNYKPIYFTEVSNSTKVIMPTQLSKCICPWQDLYSNGCKCGGV